MSRADVVMYRCAVAGVQATAADTARTFARHSHDTFGVGLVLRGAQRSASGRGPVQARAGDIITVNPGEVHDGSPFDDRGRAWRMLYLEPALVYDVASELGATMPSSVELEQPVLQDAAFAVRFERGFSAATSGVAASNRLACDEALFMLIAEFVRRHTTVRLRGSSQGQASADTANACIRRAKARIDDDPCQPLTLESLAADAGLSRFQLLRGFARDTGLPPHAYLIQRRIALARRLIEQGLPLAEAAAGAGFADQSHMTRAFSRAFGITPAQYAGAVR
ncbi:AraC family transcriptional regulator [Trinickia sp. NRRL B-1857]|uniref:AraC family transcriptional regulator n=1 Tax=Trinickia sp. NRRL B-1857 TaxID=3162879 RepID=UPI003D2976B0